MSEPFWSEGLRFECTRCSACCRFEPGYVFLSRREALALATRLGMDYSRFVAVYCRWIPTGDGLEALSLKDKSNYDCILWGDGGCSVYEDRPSQCRTFPFWRSVLRSRDAWEATASGCPGMDRGKLRSAEEIRDALAERDGEAPLTRKAGSL